jgi:hypothetical protein
MCALITIAMQLTYVDKEIHCSENESLVRLLNVSSLVSVCFLIKGRLGRSLTSGASELGTTRRAEKRPWRIRQGPVTRFTGSKEKKIRNSLTIASVRGRLKMNIFRDFRNFFLVLAALSGARALASRI